MTVASKNPQVISTLVFVFLAGGAVGALVMQLGLHDKLHKTVSAATLAIGTAAGTIPTSGSSVTGTPGSGAMAAPLSAPVVTAAGSAVLLQKFKTELSLSTDQSKEVADVLEEYRHFYQTLEDQLDDVRATGKSRILQVLNEEQKRKFEKMMVELQPSLSAK